MMPPARFLPASFPTLRATAAALAAAVLVGGCLQDDVTPVAPRYRAAVEGVLARYHVAGALVSVSVPGDSTWKQAFGYANLEDRTPFDPASHGSIRSITKSYTVTVILQLVRDQVLRLDDRLDRFIAGIPNGDRITLADLASSRWHRGLLGAAGVPRGVRGEPRADVHRGRTGRFAIPASPVFAPGAEYQYSNTNTVLLGMVIENVTGQPLGSVLQSRILTPLGLSGTSYPLTIPLPLPHPTSYAVAVDTGEAERLPLLSPTALAGAGGMVSTLADLETWGRALGDGRLIGPDLQKERIERSRLVTNGPEYDRYGLGIGILAGWWGHTGTGVGWQAATFYDPRTGSVIAAMVNETPVGGGRDLNIAQELFEALADVVATR